MAEKETFTHNKKYSAKHHRFHAHIQIHRDCTTFYTQHISYDSCV